jgi:hypothetical protein
MTSENTQEYAPIRQALGSRWPELNAALRRHYDLPPHTDTRLEVEGTMDIDVSPVAKIFLLAGRLFGALVPHEGRNVPVTVRNWSQAESSAMFWHRTFRYPGKEPVIFRSRMEYVGDNEIVEYVKYGLGIRMGMSVEGDALRFDSRGYRWNLGPLKLPIPDWLMLGRAVIREVPVSEQTFKVEFEINHPLWGRTFGYSGLFTFSD